MRAAIAAVPYLVERTSDTIDRGGRGYYKVSLLLEGTSVLVQDGRELVMRSGDISVYDTSRPYSLLFTKLIMMFPKDRLELGTNLRFGEGPMAHQPNTTHTHGKRVTTPLEAEHPLDPLTSDEIAAARRVLADAGHLGEHTRVPHMLPLDPPKHKLGAWQLHARRAGARPHLAHPHRDHAAGGTEFLGRRLGVMRYFDAFVPDDQGHPVKIPQAICMHEEDYGILWKHTDL